MKKYQKNLIHENVLSSDPTKRVRIIIYYKKFKTSNLIISITLLHLLDFPIEPTSYFCLKCPLIGYVSKENSTYVGLTTTTLSRRLTMHLNDTRSIAFHLKNNSIPKSKFRKILVENTTTIAHEIDKLRLQILDALHIK